jgi:fructose transport system substrate-binding protein
MEDRKVMFQKKYSLLVILVLTLLMLVACSGGSEEPAAEAEQPASEAAEPAGDEEVIVGLITKTETNPFFVKMKEGAQDKADELGATLMTAAGSFDGDNEAQVTAIENMINAGAQGILITPSDTRAIVPSIEKARESGVVIIALDTPTDPQDATDALFATDNFKAGQLIGQYAKSVMGDTPMKVATLDLGPGITVGILRHNGFMAGAGLADVDASAPDLVNSPEIVCSQDSQGDQTQGQTAMENCLTKDPDINVVYTINEPAAFGAYTAIENAGREDDILIVSVDGGCQGVQGVVDGQIDATSQQYPLVMASQGVEAVVEYAQSGSGPSGYTDTGVTLITDNPADGVDSEDTTFGLENCWGDK